MWVYQRISRLQAGDVFCLCCSSTPLEYLSQILLSTHVDLYQLVSSCLEHVGPTMDLVDFHPVILLLCVFQLSNQILSIFSTFDMYRFFLLENGGHNKLSLPPEIVAGELSHIDPYCPTFSWLSPFLKASFYLIKESYAHIEDAPSERSIGSIAAYAPKIYNRTSIMGLLALAVTLRRSSACWWFKRI